MTGPGRDGHGASMPCGPLEGVRVADFSHALAGPLCTMMLADLGADVIKVERPGGDQVRRWGPPFHDGDAAYFFAGNRSKRSVVLDLKDPAHRDAAERLALSVDVLVENSRPGVMARHGLAYDQLRDRRPELVYCSITAFGTGDGAKLAGYDLILQAVSGLMSVTGEAEREPMKAGIPAVDQFSGLYATIGVLAALVERARSGVGQHVEVTLLGAALASLSNRAASHLLTGSTEGRLGNSHPNVSPYELYRASDRAFVLAAPSEVLWVRTCDVLGLGHLIDDERFATNAARVANSEELKAIIEATTTTRPADDWIARFSRAGVPAGLVNDLGDAFRFADEIGLRVVDHATGRDGDASVPLVANPIRLSHTPVRPPTAPPRLDQHGDDVRAQLDLAAVPAA